MIFWKIQKIGKRTAHLGRFGTVMGRQGFRPIKEFRKIPKKERAHGLTGPAYWA